MSVTIIKIKRRICSAFLMIFECYKCSLSVYLPMQKVNPSDNQMVTELWVK